MQLLRRVWERLTLDQVVELATDMPEAQMETIVTLKMEEESGFYFLCLAWLQLSPRQRIKITAETMKLVKERETKKDADLIEVILEMLLQMADRDMSRGGNANAKARKEEMRNENLN